MGTLVQVLREQANTSVTRHGEQHLTWREWGVGGAGPTVVLLHGAAGSWTHWARNIGPLARRFHVLAPDLPGHGDSGMPEGEQTFAAMADTLWQGIDQQLGEDATVSLVGFSLGSILAESMADRQPGRVERVALLRGTFSRRPLNQPTGMLRWREGKDAADVLRIHRHNLAVSMFHDPAKIDDEAVALHADNVARSRLDPRPYIASRDFGALERLGCAVHGICGEFDAYGGDAAQEGRDLLAVLPRARFHLIRNAGHWAAYEDAEAVNAALDEALVSNPTLG